MSAKIDVECGLELEELAQSCFRAFWNARGGKDYEGKDYPDWDHLEENIQRGFGWVVRVAYEMWENGVEESAGWVAAKLFYAWWKSINDTTAPITFEELAPLERVAWEALARHVVWLMEDAEEKDNFEAVEADWGRWGAKRLVVLRERQAKSKE